MWKQALCAVVVSVVAVGCTPSSSTREGSANAPTSGPAGEGKKAPGAEKDPTANTPSKDPCRKIAAPECQPCMANNGEACEKLAARFETGTDVEKNPRLAVVLRDKACGLKRAESCEVIGDKLMAVGNQAKGIKYLASACQGGRLAACQRAGEALAKQGRFAEARVVLTVACDAEDFIPEACSQLAVFYLRGWGGAVRDLDKVKQLSKKGCDKGSELGCENLKSVGIGEKMAEEESTEASTPAPRAAAPPAQPAASRCGSKKFWCGSETVGTCCSSYQVCCKRPGGNPHCGGGTRPCMK